MDEYERKVLTILFYTIGGINNAVRKKSSWSLQYRRSS